jgi:Domain of unknown function (DUF4381)
MLPFPNIEDIAQPKAPDPPPGVDWGWWVAAVVLGLIALGLIIWLVRVLWKRSALPGAPALPEKLALRELKALGKSAGPLAAPEFAAALAGIVRSFLHRRTGLLAHYATTPEILGNAATVTAPPPPLTAAFSSVLEACDAIKFGSGAAPDRAVLIAQTEAAIEQVRRALSSPPAAPAPPPPVPPTLPAHDPVS